MLRALMENIPDLIYFKDRAVPLHPSQPGARAKSRSERRRGVHREEQCGLFRIRRRPALAPEEEEIVRSGQPQVDRIEQLKNPRGGLRWWSTTKVPMFDRNGQVSGIAGISRDITALKNSEEMLREQSEHNRMILETANDAFIGMDPDGSITAWNPRAELTFGWASAEVMGRRWYDIVIAPTDRAAHAQGVEHFLSAAQGPHGKSRPIELVAVHRDGHEFPVEATIWPVRAAGACSFNAFVRDISERRRAEEARVKETTLVQLLQSVTVAANQSSTIEHTAQICLDRICSYTGWPVGHAYLQANNLPEEPISAGLWHLEEDHRFEAFRQASERSRLAPETDLPGRFSSPASPSGSSISPR